MSPSTVWRDTKRLAGSSSFHNITDLNSGTSSITDPQAISEFLASHFSSVSADLNYDDHFLTLKNEAEAHLIFFNSTDTTHDYNLPISSSELDTCIHKNLRNSSPDPHNIHASMIKNLHSNSLTYLLSLFNAILHQSYYPHPGN